MGTQFFWFYDVAILGLLFIFMYTGWKRGLLKSLLAMLGYTVSVCAALMVSSFLAEPVYQSFVQPAVVHVVEENLDQMDVVGEVQKLITSSNLGITIGREDLTQVLSQSADLADSISQYIEKNYNGVQVPKSQIERVLSSAIQDNSMVQGFLSALPSFMTTTVTDSLSKGVEILGGALHAVTVSSGEAARYIEENILRESVVSLVRPILFVLAFALCMLIVRLLSHLFRGFNSVPLLGPVNRALGAALGLAECLVAVYLAALLVRTLVMISGDTIMFFNSATIGRTWLFRLFYNLRLW